MTTTYRGRFAPTPSGPLHFGSLTVALASWLDARNHDGEWWLRIDDIDPPREQPGAADMICRQLEQFGLHWDRKVTQRPRHALYQQAIDQLLQQGDAFYCRLSRTDLEKHHHNQHPGSHVAVPPAPGTAIRLAVPDLPITLTDGFQPTRTVNLQQLGGAFVIRRRDGLFAYHLTTAVDEIDMGMTHIIRGADLLESTALQLHVMHCLGHTPPHYSHLPLVVDRGQKLAKSLGSASIGSKSSPALLLSALQAIGLPPDPALTNAPVADILCWGLHQWPRAQVPVEPVELRSLPHWSSSPQD